MMDRNDLSHDDVVSVIFTTTTDLTSTFPAESYAALAPLGGQEAGTN